MSCAVPNTPVEFVTSISPLQKPDTMPDTKRYKSARRPFVVTPDPTPTPAEWTRPCNDFLENRAPGKRRPHDFFFKFLYNYTHTHTQTHTHIPASDIRCYNLAQLPLSPIHILSVHPPPLAATIRPTQASLAHQRWWARTTLLSALWGSDHQGRNH